MKKLEEYIKQIALYTLLFAGWFFAASNSIQRYQANKELSRQTAVSDSLKIRADSLHNQKTRLLGYIAEIDRWAETTELFITQLKNEPDKTQIVYVQAPSIKTQAAQTAQTYDANYAFDESDNLSIPIDERASENFQKYFPELIWFYSQFKVW